MALTNYSRRIEIPVPAAEVFAWHTRRGAFERLIPPWEPVEIVEWSGGIRDGARAVLRVKGPGPISVRWVAEHRDYLDGRQFRDVQTVGPFKHWVHTHRVEPTGDSSCTLEDAVEYSLPLGRLGGLFKGNIRARLDRLFEFRQAVTRADNIELHRYVDRPRQRILISGATGLVGKQLSSFLQAGGHDVWSLVRSKSGGANTVPWDPASGKLEASQLEGFDAVIHLAGESIASGRWTTAKKSRILRSRIDSTRLIADRLSKLTRPPRTWLIASAIGFYGNAGSTLLTEHSASGAGFLADVCRQWESAADAATGRGIRIANLRFGVILTPAGGALKQMLPPFKMGVGGRLGSGTQYMSWIALDDVIGAIHHTLMHDELVGPVNIVAPESVTNLEFTAAMGQVLHRPTIFPVPAKGAQLALGEMADELLLASQRVQPERLQETGYDFRYPQLPGALRHLLGT